jgi:hypothetical protein
MNGLTLLNHISVISDPRHTWKVEHSLTDIIFVMVTAVLAGADGGKILKILGKGIPVQ